MPDIDRNSQPKDLPRVFSDRYTCTEIRGAFAQAAVPWPALFTRIRRSEEIWLNRHTAKFAAGPAVVFGAVYTDFRSVLLVAS